MYQKCQPLNSKPCVDFHPDVRACGTECGASRRQAKYVKGSGLPIP